MFFLLVVGETFGLLVVCVADLADEGALVAVRALVSFELRDVVAFVVASSAAELLYAEAVLAVDVPFPAAFAYKGARLASQGA